MIVHLVINILSAFTVVDQTVTKLVQKFECAYLNAEKFFVAHERCKSLGPKRRVLLEHREIEHLSDEVPGKDS